MTWPRLVLLSVVAGVALLLLVAHGRDDAPGDDQAAGSEASSLLDVELTGFDDRTVRLAELTGKPLVVNFFASWCGPCVREMPDFEAVHARRGDDVRFLGVNLQDAPDAAMDLVAQTGVTYDGVRDVDSELFRAVDGFSMPTTVFLDAEGNVVEVHGGELSQAGLEERIDRLLVR